MQDLRYVTIDKFCEIFDFFASALGRSASLSASVLKNLLKESRFDEVMQDIYDLTLTEAFHINGFGNSLNNTLTGNEANNLLSGKSGDDTLLGEMGSDLLVGGSGADTLTGGAGADRFIRKYSYTGA